VGNTYDADSDVFAETGPMQIGVGDRMMVATSLIPDEQTQGDVTATFKTRIYPNSAESSFGPFDMANPTSVRFQGRQVQMRVTGDPPTSWGVGNMRLEVVAGSRRLFYPTHQILTPRVLSRSVICSFSRRTI